MALSEIQFTTLFNGAFGAPLEEFGLTLDNSGTPVAVKGSTVVSLHVVNDKGIEWKVNGAGIDVPFGINGHDEKGEKAQDDARQKLTAAIS